MDRRGEVEEREYSTGAKFVENPIDARDGDLRKDAEFIQRLAIHRDADATGFLRDANHLARPWGRGVLDEAGGEELVVNHAH